MASTFPEPTSSSAGSIGSRTHQQSASSSRGKTQRVRECKQKHQQQQHRRRRQRNRRCTAKPDPEIARRRISDDQYMLQQQYLILIFCIFNDADDGLFPQEQEATAEPISRQQEGSVNFGLLFYFGNH
ncbi:uncharacterized protein LOC134218265 [Armigeres subalbatus]|uniref:uncharacterized protein LOC134218265 n=1 Tax=Armigeres subalbatus TaxID=124917 RepID=UPI002ED0158D